MKRIPSGLRDFKEIIGQDYYYLDKTHLIDYIINRGSSVFLFTRPRRFGKSLNISMLDSYFNIKYAGNTWFDDLNISILRPNEPSKNAYPVIRMNFKEMNATSFERFIECLRDSIAELYDEFGYLKESGLKDNMFRRFVALQDQTSTITELERSLRYLSQMLETDTGTKTVILIDEYDNPVNYAKDPDVRKEIVDFLREFLGNALKDNDSLAFGVLTGVMRIAHADIFSGLNNLIVNDVLSPNVSDAYGFTSDEVRKICKDYGHEEKFDEAKEWYDGYLFGGTEIYNPWSVLRYVDEGFVPKTYWAGTSGNSIIAESVLDLDAEGIMDLTRMMDGQDVVRDISTEISYIDIRNPKNLFSVMVASGYLKAEQCGDSTTISLPNKEIADVFRDKVDELLNGGRKKGDELISALRDNDPERVSHILTETIDNVLGPRNREDSYCTFFLGLVAHANGFKVKGEDQVGNGYADARMIGKDENIIIEFKVTNKGESAEHAAGRALEQIHDRRYYADLNGVVTLYGIAISKKQVFAVSERLNL